MIEMISPKKSKRDIIVEAAVQLFREKGYSATTMRDIAEKVGMEAASLYNHIKSKEEILRDICFGVAANYHAHLEQVLAQKMSPLNKVKMLIRLQIAMITSNPSASLISNFEWKHLTEEDKMMFIKTRKGYEDGFRKCIESAMAVGEMKKMNSTVAMHAILASVRWMDQWYRADGDISSDTLEEDMITLLLNGLESPQK
jgi:TetR/AcrR family transcriptional regulator, cholesterol catabolism regulator